MANEYDPATSLNHYLRATGVSRGTKQMCNEGGCGVCLVTATLYDPFTKSYTVHTVNSVGSWTILLTFCKNLTVQVLCCSLLDFTWGNKCFTQGN